MTLSHECQNETQHSQLEPLIYMETKGKDWKMLVTCNGRKPREGEQAAGRVCREAAGRKDRPSWRLPSKDKKGKGEKTNYLGEIQIARRRLLWNDNKERSNLGKTENTGWRASVMGRRAEGTTGRGRRFVMLTKLKAETNEGCEESTGKGREASTEARGPGLPSGTALAPPPHPSSFTPHPSLFTRRPHAQRDAPRCWTKYIKYIAFVDEIYK